MDRFRREQAREQRRLAHRRVFGAAGRNRDYDDYEDLDDFEDYDTGDNQIWYSWHDGLGFGTPDTPPYSAGNGTGSAG